MRSEFKTKIKSVVRHTANSSLFDETFSFKHYCCIIAVCFWLFWIVCLYAIFFEDKKQIMHSIAFFFCQKSRNCCAFNTLKRIHLFSFPCFSGSLVFFLESSHNTWHQVTKGKMDSIKLLNCVERSLLDNVYLCQQ